MNSLLSKSLSFLAISFGLLFLYGIYYVGVVSPNNQKELVRMQNIATQTNEQNRVNNLQNCYNQADATYQSDWEATCLGDRKGSGCMLYLNQAKALQELRVSNRINCQNLYGR